MPNIDIWHDPTCWIDESPIIMQMVTLILHNRTSIVQSHVELTLHNLVLTYKCNFTIPTYLIWCFIFSSQKPTLQPYLQAYLLPSLKICLLSFILNPSFDLIITTFAHENITFLCRHFTLDIDLCIWLKFSSFLPLVGSVIIGN